MDKKPPARASTTEGNLQGEAVGPNAEYQIDVQELIRMMGNLSIQHQAHQHAGKRCF
jgi:hypothetical protein